MYPMILLDLLLNREELGESHSYSLAVLHESVADAISS
jgi:hypothetical protein